MEEKEIDVLVMLDTINLETSSLSYEEYQKLYHEIGKEYQGDRKKIKEDKFLNALQVKFSYAITCHKSQGGQWENVFVDLGYFKNEMLDLGYLRWLYTAITRASKKLFLINFKNDFFRLTRKLKINSSINKLNKEKWDSRFGNTSPFLKTNFLKIFEKYTKINSVIPIYITTKNGNIYGHLIKINGSKIANYLTNNRKIRFIKVLLKKINFQFFCFGNTYLSNISSCNFGNEGFQNKN